MSILADIGITKKHVLITVVVLCIVAALTLGSSLLEEVESGTYQVKQAAMTGNMTAHLTPGLYWQVFGRISVWPKAKTFYFTADTEEGESRDQSIEVRFNDGATASISGSTRIVMPISEVQAIDIITKHGYRIYSDLAARLVLPAIRSSLRMSANLMSSRESYSEKRNDFRAWAWDQVLNGVYQTEEETRRVKDPITGKEETKVYKKIKIGKDGEPLRQPSPLEGMGITLQNFEIK